MGAADDRDGSLPLTARGARHPALGLARVLRPVVERAGRRSLLRTELGAVVDRQGMTSYVLSKIPCWTSQTSSGLAR